MVSEGETAVQRNNNNNPIELLKISKSFIKVHSIII